MLIVIELIKLLTDFGIYLRHALGNRKSPYIDIALIGLDYLKKAKEMADSDDEVPDAIMYIPPIMLWNKHADYEKKIAALKQLNLLVKEGDDNGH